MRGQAGEEAGHLLDLVVPQRRREVVLTLAPRPSPPRPSPSPLAPSPLALAPRPRPSPRRLSILQFVDDAGEMRANETMEMAATAMLDELRRWTEALRPLREGAARPPRLLIRANMVRMSQVFASCLVGLRRSLVSVSSKGLLCGEPYSQQRKKAP